MEQPDFNAKGSPGKTNALQNALRRGFAERATELVLHGYRNMHVECCYQLTWGEETFSANLRKYIDQLCPGFSRATHQQWDVQRE
jgi:hypothetical protein